MDKKSALLKTKVPVLSKSENYEKRQETDIKIGFKHVNVMRN
jgi:hypothetical protein